MCKGHSGCWYKLASGDDLPPTAGWTTGSNGRSPAPTLQLFNSAAEAKRASERAVSRTGGAAIGDLVMVLPSARKKDGCVSPGEVGKFIKDDHDSQPFKIEKLDGSHSNYYYEGDMRKATDAEIAAARGTPSRTGGAAIGDLVMVLPSARKKDGCVSPGEVGKFIKDDKDHQPFKVERLDGSNSSYYYEGDMRKATDAEIAAKLTASALPPQDSSSWVSTAGATGHPVFARSVPTTQGDSLKIVVTDCGNKSKCVGEYTLMSGEHNGKPWFKNPSGAIIYFNRSWKMNDDDSKGGWYYSVGE